MIQRYLQQIRYLFFITFFLQNTYSQDLNYLFEFELSLRQNTETHSESSQDICSCSDSHTNHAVKPARNTIKSFFFKEDGGGELNKSCVGLNILRGACGGKTSHPKCFRTSGNTSESCSMDGYVYLKGQMSNLHLSCQHTIYPHIDNLLWFIIYCTKWNININGKKQRLSTDTAGRVLAPSCCPGASTWQTGKYLTISCMSSWLNRDS